MAAGGIDSRALPAQGLSLKVLKLWVWCVSPASDRSSVGSPPHLDQALRKTFERVAATGAAPVDFDALFSPLDDDPDGTLDGVHDLANMPSGDEPQRLRDDFGRLSQAITRVRPQCALACLVGGDAPLRWARH